MAKKILLEKLNLRWYLFLRSASKIFFKLFFRAYIYGQENIPGEGAFVLVSNHQSFLDPIICSIFLERPVYFLARHTLFDKPFLRWILYSVNTIPIKMDEINLSAIKKAIDKLKQGSIICIFPESTRTYDGKILPFKPGFGLLSRMGKTPAVPLMIDGAFECWPRNKKMFTLGSITLHFGQMFTLEQLESMNDKELAALFTDQLREMQNACRVKQGKKPYIYN
ncbi:MAG: 1-acyl-sn-glycerol-3-phosphate acyltransferase [Acidobacteria bacterium]|nr:1-acyl-sn-glycerol-3-phosphate acyltransferase [Acidobacteriota bacterium]